MGDLKCSIVIPYKQRLDNIKVVFASLADQTMDSSQFEVVVGAMEYSNEYVSVCQEYADRVNIVTVMSAEPWNAQRARNLAIRHATGEVLIVLDADMVVPADFLENLYDRHFQHGQDLCVVGQMIGYDEVHATHIDTVEVLPYSHYRKTLDELATTDRSRLDMRWSEEWSPALTRFPWAFARTALMALRLETFREHDLWLDEGFDGWGAEDQEWGFRIAMSGTPLVFAEDVYAIHLPHKRDLAVNGEEARITNRYYLAKWPRLDLELAIEFGWLDTDRCYPEVERELAGAVSGPGRALGVVRGRIEGRDTLVVGAEIDPESRTPVAEVDALFDPRSSLEVLPLAGFALPYEDSAVDVCRVLPAVGRLSERYRKPVLREAGRVSRELLTPTGLG
ncbi:MULTISPECIES: glycosyltransferase family 2 protein [Streptomyces]|uniref:Glycosyltransferase n=1 Tax=Streptomyces lycii TaxID=2654337 RepID=A0ABQ7FH84_9ACTN|nr:MULTISPECIES: glycosyltransferase [Streptomyces]KAF4407690.1 glycosyltransferase [Streptomyces lycii]PGH47537.1 hypothetical protein CRI70_28035 [Streptomyces sp. Ru87]